MLSKFLISVSRGKAAPYFSFKCSNQLMVKSIIWSRLYCTSCISFCMAAMSLSALSALNFNMRRISMASNLTRSSRSISLNNLSLKAAMRMAMWSMASSVDPAFSNSGSLYILSDMKIFSKDKKKMLSCNSTLRISNSSFKSLTVLSVENFSTSETPMNSGLSL